MSNKMTTAGVLATLLVLSAPAVSAHRLDPPDPENMEEAAWYYRQHLWIWCDLGFLTPGRRFLLPGEEKDRCP